MLLVLLGGRRRVEHLAHVVVSSRGELLVRWLVTVEVSGRKGLLRMLLEMMG